MHLQHHGEYYIEARIKCLNLRLRSTTSCRTRCSVTLLLQFRHSLAYRRRRQETPARRWPQTWCSDGAVVAPTKINQGRRPIQQTGPTRERAQQRRRDYTQTGVDSSPYDATTTSPIKINISPPAAHPSNAINQPSPPAGVFLPTYPPNEPPIPSCIPSV